MTIMNHHRGSTHTLPLFFHILILIIGTTSLIITPTHGFMLEAAAGAAFLGWAFNPVGPDKDASLLLQQKPALKIPELHGLLFTNDHGEKSRISSVVENYEPTVVIYAGAKVRPESYAPLAYEILHLQEEKQQQQQPMANNNNKKKKKNAVLVLQSPFNIYAFKPVPVSKVLSMFPSIQTIAGHSIGGIWAMEYCEELFLENQEAQQQHDNLKFIYLGVHSAVVSLAKFKSVPMKQVTYTYATNDVTLVNAAATSSKNELFELSMEEYVTKIQNEELPTGAKIVRVEGGNHSQYGYYGSPGYKNGLAYEDLDAKIGKEEQMKILARVFVD